MYSKNPLGAAVSSLKAGGGKTLNIILQAFLKQKANTPPIISVPSIFLQEEYRVRLISAGLNDSEIVIINSTTVDQHESVSRKFFQTLPLNKTIIITHEALKLIDHRSSNKALYANRDLLIDEAFDPISMTELTVTTNSDGVPGIRHIDWKRWLNPTGVIVDGFVELMPCKGHCYNDIYNMTKIKTIENRNYKLYISESNWNSLLANNAQKINIFGLYDINILAQFKSISISSAAFHTTTLGIFLKNSGVNLNLTHAYEKHDEKIIFHLAKINNELYSHSKGAIAEHHERVETFRNYVAKTLQDRESLLLRNISDTTSLPYSRYHQISNNCHGINSFRHIDAISIECAYNANNNQISFMQSIMKFTREQSVLVIAANTFYQCILRTCIRDKSNTKPVDVFLLDSKVFPHLVKHYFNNYEIKDINIGNFDTRHREESLSSDHIKIKQFIENTASGEYKASTLYDSFVTKTGSTTSIRKFALSLSDLGLAKRHTKYGKIYRV